MTERSTPPAPPTVKKKGGQGQGKKPVLPPPPSEPPAASSTTSTTTSADDTAVRGGLVERVQAKLAAAAGSATSGADADAGTAPSGKGRPQRGPRRARLRLTRIDPWSVMKAAFLLSIAFGIVTVVAVAMVWQVLDTAGVWESINTSVRDTIGSKETANFDVEDYLGTSRVLGFTMLIAAVDVILITAIATLGAFLYNMSAALLGGIEVTLAEDN